MANHIKVTIVKVDDEFFEYRDVVLCEPCGSFLKIQLRCGEEIIFPEHRVKHSNTYYEETE